MIYIFNYTNFNASTQCLYNFTDKTHLTVSKKNLLVLRMILLKHSSSYVNIYLSKKPKSFKSP